MEILWFWIGQLCQSELFITFRMALWSIRLSCTELHGLTFAQNFAWICVTQFEWRKKRYDRWNKAWVILSYGNNAGAGRKKKDPKYGWGNACDRDNAERSAVTHQVFSIGMVEGPQGFLSLCIGLLRASTIYVEVLTSAQRWHLIRAAELVASWRLKIFRNPKDW